MALFAVRSDGPTRIPADGGKPVTVTNLGASPIFFGTEQGVSSSLKTGEIAQNASTTISQPTYFIVEPPARVGTNVVGVREQVVETTQTGTQLDRLPPGSVSTADLAPTAGITNAQLAGSITQDKTVPGTLPAPGAEKSITVATAGVARKVTAVFVGDGVLTVAKIKHNLETEAVDVVVQKGAETNKPGENFLNAAGAGNVTWKPISLSEVEVTFGTAPIAKFQAFVTVIG